METLLALVGAYLAGAWLVFIWMQADQMLDTDPFRLIVPWQLVARVALRWPLELAAFSGTLVAAAIVKFIRAIKPAE
ncbi:MAG: hypothetical protein LDL56_00570 [Armatimonadetes bacterium]|nr:hypothetical protein [Armatimonadota bacterium]MCA1995703.1 hypothetical protein [Armatimonadota bacterium]